MAFKANQKTEMRANITKISSSIAMSDKNNTRNANSLIISSHHHLSRPAESCLFVDLSADHSMVLEVRDTDKKSLGA